MQKYFNSLSSRVNMVTQFQGLLFTDMSCANRSDIISTVSNHCGHSARCAMVALSGLFTQWLLGFILYYKPKVYPTYLKGMT